MSTMLPHLLNETDLKDITWIAPGWRAAFVSFRGLFSEPRTYTAVFLGCGLRGLCWKKRSRPPLRSAILLCTRVTCQLMWPRWDVNRSGKNQMFSFTSGASTLFFSRRWQANMSRYWPGTLGLWEGGHALGARVQKTSRYNCARGRASQACRSLTATYDHITSTSDALLMQSYRPKVAHSASQQIPTPRNLKMAFTTPLRCHLMCVRHCLMDPRLTGLARLRLTSTRLFLAEDLLTAHLTLWSAHKRQLTVADSRHAPSPIYSYNTLLTRCTWRGLQPRFRWKQTNKLAAWRVQKYHKGKVDFQPAHVTSSSFGEAVEGMWVGGSGCL